VMNQVGVAFVAMALFLRVSDIHRNARTRAAPGQTAR